MAADQYTLQFISDDAFMSCQESVVVLTQKLLEHKHIGGSTVNVYGQKWWADPDNKMKLQLKPTLYQPVNVTNRMPVIKIVYAAYESGPDEHTILYVQNEYLENGWSLFDADGKEGLRDLLHPKGKLMFNLPMRGRTRGMAVVKGKRRKLNTPSYDTIIIENHSELTPERSINRTEGYFEDMHVAAAHEDGDHYNKGFCGIFTLIFLCFYYKNKNDERWVENWKIFINKMSEEVEMSFLGMDKKKRGKQYALKSTHFAQNIYNFITKDTDYSELTLDNMADALSQKKIKKIVEYVNKHIEDEIAPPTIASGSGSGSGSDYLGTGVVTINRSRRRAARSKKRRRYKNRKSKNPRVSKKRGSQ